MGAPEKVVTSVKALIKNNKVFIASKSYCPYCTATKQAFNKLVGDNADVTIYELDTIQGGDKIQQALYDITGQTTVPNVFINGEHIGGNDKVQSLISSGQLQDKLKAAL